MVKEIQRLTREFHTQHSKNLENIRETAQKFREACSAVQRSWSGSFAGWHGRMYFRDFQTPSLYERFSGEWGGINGIPDGWEEKQPEEVREKIEQLVGKEFLADRYENTVQHLRKDAETLKKEIVINLDALDADEFSGREKELLGQIERFAFGKTKGEFIQDGLPGTLMSRDTEALRQGTCIASWLYYEGVALEGRTLCDSIDDFMAMTDRLIRMVENKKGDRKFNPAPAPLSNLHKDIYEKCHDLYEKKAYAEAAEKGFKVVRDRLRKLTGHETGSEAFGKGKLHIRGAAAPNVDQDFNDAVKFLTMAVDRFRNEKSHTSDARIDDPIRAYEYLRLSSLAMNLLEDTEILP